VTDKPNLADALGAIRSKEIWVPLEDDEEPASSLAEFDAERAAIARVRALHKMMLTEYGGPAYCTEDSARWPCPTIRALEGEQ
jgi:hypothetical protein